LRPAALDTLGAFGSTYFTCFWLKKIVAEPKVQLKLAFLKQSSFSAVQNYPLLLLRSRKPKLQPVPRNASIFVTSFLYISPRAMIRGRQPLGTGAARPPLVPGLPALVCIARGDSPELARIVRGTQRSVGLLRPRCFGRFCSDPHRARYDPHCARGDRCSFDLIPIILDIHLCSFWSVLRPPAAGGTGASYSVLFRSAPSSHRLQGNLFSSESTANCDPGCFSLACTECCSLINRSLYRVLFPDQSFSTSVTQMKSICLEHQIQQHKHKGVTRLRGRERGYYEHHS
jgi:hypothetical protein